MNPFRINPDKKADKSLKTHKAPAKETLYAALYREIY
jgi:hypothetical protein